MTNIVLDLEWNKPLSRARKKAGLMGEIIQIGAAKIDDEGEILDTFSVLVKPTYYYRVHKEITELTLITTEDLQSGVPFPEAIKIFKEWCGHDFLFITWSDTDLRVLANNLDIHDLDKDWLPISLDAQLMFDDIEMQEDKNWALTYALFHFNEKPSGLHNALSDVLSTILVLRHFDIKEALADEYFRYDDLINIGNDMEQFVAS